MSPIVLHWQPYMLTLKTLSQPCLTHDVGSFGSWGFPFLLLLLRSSFWYTFFFITSFDQQIWLQRELNLIAKGDKCHIFVKPFKLKLKVCNSIFDLDCIISNPFWSCVDAKWQKLSLSKSFLTQLYMYSFGFGS